MKSEYLIINTYIDNATKMIKDGKTQLEVKDELFSHLIEVYETNLARGMSDEDAQTDAVTRMGDSKIVADSFKKLYPISMPEFFRRMGWIIIFPILFEYRVYDNLFDFDFLLITLGFMFGMWHLRKVNKLFKTAFVLNIINFVMQSAIVVIKGLVLLDKSVTMGMFVAEIIFITAIFIIILAGIINVKIQLNEPNIDLILAKVSILLVILSGITMFLTKYFDSLLCAFLVVALNVLPCIVIYTTVKDIHLLNYKVPSTRHFAIKYLTCLALFFCFILGIGYIGEFVDSKTSEYVVDDTTVNVTEIKENMISLGLPREIADDLPESEILMYENATELRVERCEDYEEILANKGKHEFDELYSAYIFTIDKNDESIEMRILFDIARFDQHHESDQYTKILFYSYDYETFEPTAKDIFCVMLCDIDGVTHQLPLISNEVVQDDSDKEYKFKNVQHIYGFVRNSTNHRAYIAQTIKADANVEKIGIYNDYGQYSMSEFNNPFEPYYMSLYDHIHVTFDNPLYNEKVAEDIRNEINELYAN